MTKKDKRQLHRYVTRLQVSIENVITVIDPWSGIWGDKQLEDNYYALLEGLKKTLEEASGVACEIKDEIESDFTDEMKNG